MEQEEKHYVAYLEDIYDDLKGQKKFRAWWLHNNREVECVIPLQNPHPREVFITPYAQVISTECVDEPATVLTPEHYCKCLAILSDLSSTRVHLCYKEFRSNKVKLFDDRRPMTVKYVLPEVWVTSYFKANENVEILCQDSGIRGCWFRCTVLVVSRKQLKVQYDDLMDKDGCGNLEAFPTALHRAGTRLPNNVSLEMAIPVPVPPTYRGLSGEKAVEAEEDFYWILMLGPLHIYQLCGGGSYRRGGGGSRGGKLGKVRMVRTRSQRIRHVAEGRLAIKATEVRERIFGSLGYDAELPMRVCHLEGLDIRSRELEYVGYFYESFFHVFMRNSAERERVVGLIAEVEINFEDMRIGE
ncbi:hypothetical protein GIB67_035035 [Kingdonia uniflora]|uniref:BAH domain-containing protein n=1 Tax=Kingdonia uniflora TaxID=39325 RepID=A0A7J7L1H5_9MAGN|nr:hypothetical protein GIB67_035035 [Kingdonia uniflora]